MRAAGYVLRRGVVGSGENPSLPFSLQAFLFLRQKEMPKRGIYIIRLECVVKAELIICPCIGYNDNGAARAVPTNGRQWIFQEIRAAYAAAVRRGLYSLVR